MHPEEVPHRAPANHPASRHWQEPYTDAYLLSKRTLRALSMVLRPPAPPALSDLLLPLPMNGSDYVVRLEQGRVKTASTSVLTALAAALNLVPDQQEDLLRGQARGDLREVAGERALLARLQHRAVGGAEGEAATS